MERRRRAALRVEREERFGPAYYARYYGDARTRVHDAARIGHLARGVTELVAWHGGPLRSVLDVGAGVGLWRDWFARNMPRVSYRSIEVSAHACATYGHEQRDITTWRDRARYDLVVCQGVLQYIDDAGAARAIDNLGAMAGGFVYLEAITRGDFDNVCDQERTDGEVFLREATWYRARLARWFDNVGGGLYYARRGPLSFYELERA